jgi:hypothetical protein
VRCARSGPMATARIRSRRSSCTSWPWRSTASRLSSTGSAPSTLLAFNAAVLAAGLAVAGRFGNFAIPVFGLGVVACVLAALVQRQQHDYYRAARDRMTRLERQLDIPEPVDTTGTLGKRPRTISVTSLIYVLTGAIAWRTSQRSRTPSWPDDARPRSIHRRDVSPPLRRRCEQRAPRTSTLPSPGATYPLLSGAGASSARCPQPVHWRRHRRHRPVRPVPPGHPRSRPRTSSLTGDVAPGSSLMPLQPMLPVWHRRTRRPGASS